MKPRLIHNCAIYYLDNHLTRANVTESLNAIANSLSTLRGLNIKAIFFSFANVKEFESVVIDMLAKTIKRLEEKVDIVGGFCDYTNEQYNSFKSFTKVNINLFKTLDIALLLLNIKTTNTKIAIYDENELNLQLLTSELTSRGYDVIVTKENELDKYSNAGYIAIHNTTFNIIENFISVELIDNIVLYKLSKTIDNKFTSYFNLQKHAQRIKDGFKIFAFDASEVISINVKALELFETLALSSISLNVKIAFVNMDYSKVGSIAIDRLRKCGVLFFSSLEELKKDKDINAIAKSTKHSSGLNKSLVSTLPVFVEATAETFLSLLNSEITKKSHKISKFNINSGDFIASSINFDGDIDGSFILVFERKLSKEISETILGESPNSDEELEDVLREFANIIAGRAKAILATKETFIKISLPKAYLGVKDLTTQISSKDGVFIEFGLKGNVVYAFLTR